MKLKERLRMQTLTSEERNAYNAKCEMLKLTLNSIYGKFGQKLGKTFEITEIDSILHIYNKNHISDFEVISLDYDNDDILFVQYTDNSNNLKNNIGCLVHIASYITAKARTNLCEMMRLIGHENVLYFDTDSIFYISEIPPSQDPIIHQYIDDERLGAWKLENTSDITEFISLGPKMYCYFLNTTRREDRSGDKNNQPKVCFKMKGVPHDLVSSNDFILMCQHYNNKVNLKIEYVLDYIMKKRLFKVDYIEGYKRSVTTQLTKRKFIGLDRSDPLDNIPSD